MKLLVIIWIGFLSKYLCSVSFDHNFCHKLSIKIHISSLQWDLSTSKVTCPIIHKRPVSYIRFRGDINSIHAVLNSGIKKDRRLIIISP